MLSSLPAERYLSVGSDADCVMIEELDLGGRLVGRLEVAEDNVAKVPAGTIETPDDEARPDVVFKAAEE